MSTIMGPLAFLTVLLVGQAMSATPALEAVAKSNSKFSRDFFKSLENKEGNLVSSPLSAHLALAMTQLGTGGNTASVMSAALHLPQNEETSNEGFKQLSATLHSENSAGISLKIANRMYYQRGFTPKKEFLSSVKETFDSDPQSVDFANATTRVIINQWVEEVTQNKIKDLIENGSLDPEGRLILINAVYFYGKWENKFEPGSTHGRDFYTSETNVIQVPFMGQTNSYKYAELQDLSSKMVVLPYEGSKMSLVMLLPDSRTGLSQLEKKMQTQDLSAIINSATPNRIELYMPKFKIETTIDLIEPLTKMGMGEIFGNYADFSKISRDVSLKISSALQKTIIQVAENGTEAVSVTNFGAGGSSGIFKPPPHAVVDLDHPFLFYLVHHTSDLNNVILFSGRVVEPQGYELQKFPF